MHVQPVMRKLSVRRESLRELTVADLQQVAAGYPTVTQKYTTVTNMLTGAGNIGGVKTGA